MTESKVPYNVKVTTVIPYENWHKHTKYSNVFTPDSILSIEDLAKRAVELGQKTLSTVEHGYAGNIFEYKDVADKYGLKLVFGVEFYYVKDRFEKDRTNSHLLIMAKNDNGRKALTRLISEANETGYYYKPRIDESLLFSLNPKDVVVTSTCIASPYNLYDNYECFITQCHDYFKENFFLEIHDNTNWKQVEFNKKIKKLNEKYNIPYVFATDTHYIHPEDSVYRDDLLRGKGIFYDEEEGFIMDYPTAETALERFEEQGVFTREEVLSAFENTLIARDFEELNINKDIKMPTLYPDKTHEEKIKILKKIVNNAWVEDRKHIKKERHKEYLEAIKFEMSIIENTKMEDYFLLNYEVIKRAKELGGILTRTGRGCFKDTALVQTLDGLKKISDVEIGDKVINRFGEFDTVLNKFEYHINEEMVRISHLNSAGKHNAIESTLDHKILVKDGDTTKFIQAKDLKKGDYVCMPKIKWSENEENVVIDLNDYNDIGFKYDDEYIYEEYSHLNESHNKKVRRFIELDKDLNFLFGLMYGDGNTNKNRINLYVNSETHKNIINRKAFELFAEKLELSVKEYKPKNKNMFVLSLNSVIVCKFFENMLFKSSSDKDKIFNNELYNQNKKNLKSLRDGLTSSDGCVTDATRISFDNTSMSLISAYKMLSDMIGDSPHSMSVREAKVCNRGYNKKESYKLRRTKRNDGIKKCDIYLEDDDYFYLPVTKVELLEAHETYVYDLQVENDPSFVIYNMVVHNSAPSFYLNKLLGFTEVDRLDAPIELFPTRFMSESRILQTVSLPDVDYNCADPKPFIQATRELLGENNCYYMTAFGTMQESEALRNLGRSREIPASEINDIAKDIDSYRKNAKWSPLIEQSSNFIGTIDSVSPHPCFLSGTLVNTKDGYKNIENIKKGDYVLTHTNEYKKVLETMNRDVSEYYDLKLQGSPSTLVTGNHPYLVKERIVGKDSKRIFSDAKWKSVEELGKGDFVGYAINQEEVIPYEEGLPTDKKEFWWLMGRYLGDGWWKNERPNNKQLGEYNTIICCGKHELGQIEEYAEKLSSYFNFHITEGRTTFRYNFLSKKLWNFVKENMGKGSKDKFISSKILNLPKDLLKSFVDGYVSADGHVLKSNKVTITTTSKQIAYAIQQCIIKSYHTSASLTKVMRKDSILEGRLLKGNLQYVITFKEGARTIAYIEDDYIWMPFRNKVKVYSDATVYNMEVEDDHSYTANNVIVHNCACLLMTEDIREEVGIIRVGDELCAVIDSYYSDVFKFLKNDYLCVTVWKIIGQAFEKVGMEIPDVRELSKLVESDEKVWDLYKDGIVATLNQAGTASGKPQVMQYSPRSIRELSGWVSAIRPSFSSMKAYFLNREPFSYGIPTFDKILESSDNFVLYQENIMSALVYVGFPEDETYGLLKAIAKKKEGIIEPIHDKFIDGFKKKVIEEDGTSEEIAEEQALKVWKIIEDAVGYGFNSSHAYSVALDSIYGAYLKANYPLEYYATVLEIYQGDTDKTGEIVKELPYFNIELKNIEYGKSAGSYLADSETNSVYKGIASIKFLNKKIGDDFLEISKNEKLSNLSWLEFCQYVLDNKIAQSNQMEILIRLDFFKKFGEKEILLEFYLVMTDKKKVNLISYPEFAPQTIKIEKRNKQKEIRYEDKVIKKPLKYESKHSDKTKEERLKNLKEFYDILLERPPKKISLYEQVSFEKEFLGYAYSTWEHLSPKICLVLDINKKYTPLITMYQVSTGKEFLMKVKKKNFWMEDESQMLYEGDVIQVTNVTQEEGWKQVDGKWERNPNKIELHLNQCSLIRKSPMRNKLTK